jgi:hypothetical protein
VTRLPPLRAPAADGGVLAVPPLEDAERLLRENRDRLRRVDRRLLGRPFSEVRELARSELLEAARRYTNVEPRPSGSGSGEEEPAAHAPGSDGAPLILAGHQPELFHPGVWVKNFALAGLARRHGATAVHLLVDNDTVKSTALAFPVRGDPWPESRTLPYDRWQGETPWEERRVLDPSLFQRFGADGSALLREWGFEPILASFWPEVLREAGRRGGLLGDSFAAARRGIERSWGCANLEVPLSHVCRGEAFATLAGELLADLPRFVGVYNAVVREHRERLRIRSRHHPVPDLAARGDWLEVPLWGWRASQPRRARLFARRAGDRLELKAGEEPWPALPFPGAAGARPFLEAWRGLEAAGYKVRSRALITTLFARLFPGDLFVHGIGGGKYDELTDRILGRFWGLQPPEFLVLSATCRLPLPAYPETPNDRRRLASRMRDLRYNPQRHVPAGREAEWANLVREKQRWIAQAPEGRAARRERFRQLRRLSEALSPAVADELRQAQEDARRVERHLDAKALLRRRDYSFCLYPESVLRPFYARFL